MSTKGGDVVRQAQEMVSEQMGCTPGEALAAMQDTADASGETLEFIAAEVHNGSLRYDS
jgi:hypothetical protein